MHDEKHYEKHDEERHLPRSNESTAVSAGWISVADRLPTDEDGSCPHRLVICLRHCPSKLQAEITIAFFDDPKDYQDPKNGEGWIESFSQKRILVTHWMRLPDFKQVVGRFDGMDNREFRKMFGTVRPHLGLVIEKSKEKNKGKTSKNTERHKNATSNKEKEKRTKLWENKSDEYRQIGNTQKIRKGDTFRYTIGTTQKH